MFKPLIAMICLSAILYADGENDQKEPEESAPVLFEETQVPTQTFVGRSAIPEPVSQAPPELEKPYKRPWLATSLSAIYPGLGHAYLDDYRTAATLGSVYGLEMGMLNYASKNEEERSRNTLALRTTQFYGIYAAYRDVRAFNKKVGFRYPMPTDSFQQLLYAPFDWSIIKKPEVWGGVLGCLGVAVTVVTLSHSKDEPITSVAHICSEFPAINPFMAFAIGIGEESFFRGYLQSALSESLTPIGGMITSNLLFTAAHIGNASTFSKEDRKRYYVVSLPVIGSIGAYCSWLTYKNHSLRESVALHSWYDFILLAASAAVTKAIVTQKKEVAFSFTY